jgi:hypothetical protein
MEFAFLRFRVKLVLVKSSENFFDVFPMFFRGVRIDEDVVDVDEDVVDVDEDVVDVDEDVVDVDEDVVDVDEDVVDVDEDADVEEVRKDVVHESLKGCGSICQTERHNDPFKRTVACAESGLPLVAFADSD